MHINRLLLLLSLAWSPAFGQSGGSASDHELIQQLLTRVSELEAEIQRLKTGAGSASAPAASAAPAVAGTAASAPAQSAAPPPAMQQPGMVDMQPSGLPGMKLQGFSDIQYRATDLKGDHNTFLLGQFDLFITSRISDKFNVLSEVVVEADPNNAMGIDLERLLFQYSASDYFNLSAGRFHSAIGFYNTAYHHSTWLQTTVDRPFLFAFEDEGGILPIHNVGLTASGRVPSGKLGLHYVAELGNGRASRSPLDEAVQNVQDENNRKSFNLALFARPDAVRGLQAGFSVYHDRLTPGGLPAIGQTILAGHAVYQPGRFELLNEVVVLRHSVEGIGGRLYNIPAFYSQLSRDFGKVRPYFRYEYINVPRNEPLFQDVGLRHGPTAGLRFNFSEFAAFKLEYNRIVRRQLPEINGLRTQVAFTF
jgi:hypothetical protein